MKRKIKRCYLVDRREPKKILNTEMYLTPPMVRKILNCSYDYARLIIKTGRDYERKMNLLVLNDKTLKIRTSTFKKIVEGKIIMEKKNGDNK